MSKRTADAGSAHSREAAPLFAALGDETRLGIVLRLADEGPQSITRLTAGTTVTRQAVTRHLVVLERAGVVRGKKRGREHLWELELARLDEAGRWLAVISRQWDDALARLRAMVEEGGG
jgi:DNA-binding transcriptional ArsR family regulator